MVATFRGEAQYETGEPAPNAGHLTCLECGFAVSPHIREKLPLCPACGGSEFRRGRFFEPSSMTMDSAPAVQAEPLPVTQARERLDGKAPHLVWLAGDEVRKAELAVGWARIGRSASADIRLDDPTVSRRHALVVRTATGTLRALDDRSLNGLFLNGERVEGAQLKDGDELEIGRFRLYVCG